MRRDIVVALRGGGVRGESTKQVPTEVVLHRWEEWFPRGAGLGSARTQALEIARAIGLGPRIMEDEQALHRSLRRAFQDLRLFAFETDARVEASRAVDPTEAESDARDQRPGEEVTHWIAIQLLEEGPDATPVPHARYVLKLPDGRVLRGKLDAQGLARADDIPAGVCQVSFPDYDDRSFDAPAKGAVGGAPLPPPRQTPTSRRDDLGVAVGMATREAQPCEVVRVWVEPKAKRSPSARGLIQLVPVPNVKTTENLDIAQGFKPEVLKSLADFAQVVALRRQYGTLREFADGWDQKQKAKAGDAEDGHGAMERTLKIASARWGGGTAELKVEAEHSPSCARAHTIELRGPKPTRAEGPSTTLLLAHDGHGPTTGDAAPTRYTVATRGCRGEERTLRVDVFPSDQELFSAGIEAKRGTFEKIVGSVNEVLKRTSVGASELSLTGGFETFVGWRQQPGTWRAYHCRELAVKGEVKWEASLDFSFVSMVTHIPPGLLKYAGDIGIKVGPEFSAELRGAVERREFPAAESEPALADRAGEIKLSGKGAIVVELHAHLGPRSILAVEASGKVEPALKPSGAVTIDGGTAVLSMDLTLEECVFEVAVKTQALFWKREKNWKFPIWESKELLKSREFVLHDGRPGH